MNSATADDTTPPLTPCPNSPNCVSSLSPETDQEHYIAPFSYSGDPAAAWQRLQTAVLAEERVTLVEARDNYLHAEVRSLVFRFVDDVEFSLNAGARLIHVRSASRVGYSDFGVNRKRVEKIRVAFDSQPGG
ncbi:MAG TPA: DUF1499 domain-containing protein [Gammaproteobacteria bacterium]|nr:DUF1499 domain-containing protein [Gammaproteobacteria bacterium]